MNLVLGICAAVAALVGAGLLSVLILPMLATRLSSQRVPTLPA